MVAVKYAARVVNAIATLPAIRTRRRARLHRLRLGDEPGAVDVVTVSDQRLEGALDRDAIDCCVRVERCLVTLDAEFGNPLLHPPRRYAPSPWPSPPSRGEGIELTHLSLFDQEGRGKGGRLVATHPG